MPGRRHITFAFLLVLIHVHFVSAQSKIYRGRLDNKHIQMQLNRQGDVMLGSYFYDQFQKDLRLEGRYNKDGRLELREMDGTGRHTGTFLCKRPDEMEAPAFDVECDWTKPDGSGQVPVFLTEQSLDLPKGFVIKPRQIFERGRIVNVSYPELITSGTRVFNASVMRRVRRSIREFIPDREPDVSFDANYNILLATDEVISIEMEADSYSGGAHPNEEWWTFNYDVRNDREFKLADLIRDEAGFKTAIWKYSAGAINKLDQQLQEQEARRPGGEPEKREQPIASIDEPAEILAWGFSPKGVVVYFDFAHVMAVFTKVIVPYSEVKNYVKPGAPIAKFIR